jgi:hypothetical protein
MLMSPCHYYGYFDPTRMENRIWGDRIGNLSVWCRRFKAFVRCDARSLWLVIIPKSKDRFMERPPMKTIQPWAYMGMAWHSIWYSLVLAYQPFVRGSYDGRTAEMFSEAAMAEPWRCVGTAATAVTHKAQEGASGWVQCSHWRWNLSEYVKS